MTDNRTTELREKLTERGVKWWPMRNNGYYEDRDTEFVANGKKHTAHEWGDGLAVYNLTPEQAIAATLGNPEIVRCRDCKHIVWTDNPMTSTHYWCIENDRPCCLDDFCSLAERREDGSIESIYDWQWVRDLVGEEEAERRKEKQKAVGE